MRFLVLAAALSLSTACTAHRQLRLSTVPVDVTAPLSDPRARAAVATSSIERYPGYTIAIVEFDDQAGRGARNRNDEGGTHQRRSGSEHAGVRPRLA